MWHVDEGALHAYLDGALDALPAAEAERIREHLGACSDCAGRLEEERAVRAEAAAILAGAAPDPGQLPSLEELRARASVGRAGAPWTQLRRLGWAASIVVAVGAGWMLRGSRAPGVEAPAPAVTAEEAGAPTGPPDARPTQVAAQPEPASGRPEEEASSPAPDGPSRPAAAAGEAAAPAPAAPVLVEPDPVPTALVAEAPPFQRPGGMAALADSLAARLGEAKVASEPVAADVPASVALPSPSAATNVAAAARLRADAVTGEEVARRRVSQELRRDETSALGAAWAWGVPERLVIPGHPVLSLSREAGGLPVGTVRVVQLVDGDTLEVLHLPPGSDPGEVTGRADEDRTRVVLARGEGWIVAWGSLPRARIVTLLAGVGGGG